MDKKRFTKNEYEKAIDQVIVGENKAKRDRNILKARLIDGETLEEIEERENLSSTRTFLIIKKWQQLIIKYLNDAY